MLTAAPLAFLLILPAFFYYCLRTLVTKQEHANAYSPVEARIPEYLIKQYVDKNRRVRTNYRKPVKKITEPKTKQKTSPLPRKTHSVQPVCTGMVKMETLGKCSIGLSQYACINNELKMSNASM